MAAVSGRKAEVPLLFPLLQRDGQRRPVVDVDLTGGLIGYGEGESENRLGGDQGADQGGDDVHHGLPIAARSQNAARHQRLTGFHRLDLFRQPAGEGVRNADQCFPAQEGGQGVEFGRRTRGFHFAIPVFHLHRGFHDFGIFFRRPTVVIQR